MFNLLRHFSIASGIVVILVTATLAGLYNRHATAELVKSAENHNTTLAQSFANILRPRFFHYISTMTDLGGDSLRAHPTTRKIDDALRELTSGLPILKVKIYNLNGLTVYSSEFSQIGEDRSKNSGFSEVMSAENGTPASKLSFRGTFSAFSGVLANRSLVESYVPIMGENGAIEGVFELYTDVTPLVDRIKRGTVRVVAGIVLAFGLLYGTLFLIVRRADHILRRQYATLISNGEDLTAQNIRLEREVTDRQRAEEALKRARIKTMKSSRTFQLALLSCHMPRMIPGLRETGCSSTTPSSGCLAVPARKSLERTFRIVGSISIS